MTAPTAPQGPVTPKHAPGVLELGEGWLASGGDAGRNRRFEELAMISTKVANLGFSRVVGGAAPNYARSL
jgi:hypothetical protein